MQSDDLARKAAAQYVLWLALRTAGAAASHQAPFVTAEIWRALPVPAGNSPRIWPWSPILVAPRLRA